MLKTCANDMFSWPCSTATSHEYVTIIETIVQNFYRWWCLLVYRPPLQEVNGYRQLFGYQHSSKISSVLLNRRKNSWNYITSIISYRPTFWSNPCYASLDPSGLCETAFTLLFAHTIVILSRCTFQNFESSILVLNRCVNITVWCKL